MSGWPEDTPDGGDILHVLFDKAGNDFLSGQLAVPVTKHDGLTVMEFAEDLIQRKYFVLQTYVPPFIMIVSGGPTGAAILQPVFYFPSNAALRFSIKALQPSWKSMEAAHSR